MTGSLRGTASPDEDEDDNDDSPYDDNDDSPDEDNNADSPDDNDANSNDNKVANIQVFWRESSVSLDVLPFFSYLLFFIWGGRRALFSQIFVVGGRNSTILTFFYHGTLCVPLWTISHSSTNNGQINMIPDKILLVYVCVYQCSCFLLMIVVLCRNVSTASTISLEDVMMNYRVPSVPFLPASLIISLSITRVNKFT